MNTERQLHNLCGLLRVRYGTRTYPEPQHDPKTVADLYEHEGRQAAMKKFNLSEHWVRRFHKQFYPPKPRGSKPKQEEKAEVKAPSLKGNYKSMEDLIENCYREGVIRNCYALLLSGKTDYQHLPDVDRIHISDAAIAPYQAVITQVARNWNSIKNKPKAQRI